MQPSESWTFSFQPLPRERAHLEVGVMDPNGQKVPGAVVYFYSGGKPVERATTDASGKASVCIFPTAGVHDLHVTAQGMEAWLSEVALPPGERRSLTVALENDTVSMSGRVLARDGSPQNAIVVQAVRIEELREILESASSGQGIDRDRQEKSGPRGSAALPNEGRADPPVRPDVGLEAPLGPLGNRSVTSLLPLPPFSATTFTDTNGVFRFVNLQPGKYRLRCHGLRGYSYADGGEEPDSVGTIEVETGRTHAGIDFVLPEIKKGVWTTLPFATRAPLEHRSIYRTPDGLLWIGTLDYTLQAFDGREYKSFALTDEPNEVAKAMEYSADATLWIGSASGISKVVEGQRKSVSYDASRPESGVNDILAESDGTVWFATRLGLCRYDGRDFVTFSVKDGLPSNEVLSVLRSRDGTLWVGTSSGLVAYDGVRFLKPKSFPHEGRVQSLLESRGGAIWFAGTVGQGAYCYDRASLRHFSAKEGLLTDTVQDIAKTSDGVLWFATTGGISRFNGATVVNYTESDGLTPGKILDLFVDTDDVLWCAGEQGLRRFDPKGFTAFGKRDGLINSLNHRTAGVVALERDASDGLWIGTGWGGVWRSNSGRMESQNTNSCFFELHRAADRTIWAGGSHGIFRVENGAPVRVLDHSWVNALTSDDRGSLWFGDGWQEGGLLRFNPASRALSAFTVKDGLPNNRVYAIEPTSEGGLWVGTEIGLAHYLDGKIEDLRKKFGIATGAVWELRRDDGGKLWISTAQGLHILDPILGKGSTGDPPVPSGNLPDGTVAAALTDSGAGFASSPAPIPVGKLPTGAGRLPALPEARVAHATIDGFRRLSITTTNGLPVEDIRCSVQTRDGILWMGSLDRGVVGFDGKAFTRLDPRDSPIGERVLALMVDEDDSLWVGSDDTGLVHYRRSKTPPTVRLVNVRMDDVVSSDFSNIPSTEIKTRVAVEYREIDLKTHPDKRQFWYEVEGPTGATLFAGVTKERSFAWTPRQGGTYTFQVQAIDRDLNYSKPARVMMRVVVPWHANAWILTPMVFVFGSLLVWAFIARALYMRKSREAALLSERVRISRDLHDHLGAGLTHLAMVGDLVHQRADQPGAVEMLANRLTESARDLTRTMGEIIWTTDPDKDTLRSFAFFINSYADRFFAGSTLRLRFEFPSEVPDLVLPAEHRSSLLTVTKEALNNVAKHARASELRIKLALRDQQLYLSFEDDGQGFLMSQVDEERHGLVNMQERLRALGGQLQIESAVGQGTRVHVRLPLPQKQRRPSA
ncbi:MAG: carboxypeptidase regulatory-like domain-containing protein [Verrucomicrobia bacterium]|nr:carboxypeptidase regulatory-like domain-containing protein [Verrucomicrobiota bacterium]